jgi:phosphatidyl-myo-inositol dimannoside synthase
MWPSGFGTYMDIGDPCVEIKLSPLSRFLAACQWRAWRLARRFQPKLVYAGSGLMAPAAVMAARSVGARSACFLHGLDIVVDHPIYRRLFVPAIRRHDRVLVNSQHTADLAKQAGVKPDRIRLVHPGVDLPDLSVEKEARRAFRERFALGNRPLLLTAGRLTERKGLAPFIRNSLPEIIQHEPDAVFVVIGGEASQALQHRKGVMTDIRSAAKEVGLDSQVRLLGSVTDAELSQAYFAADLLVFPVLELPGDVEGFGMVAIEAAAHGLRSVAFRVGGVPDAIADDVSGWLLEPGDYSQ